METVVQAPPEELNLLTTWGDPDEPARRRRAAVGTVLFHIVAIGVFFSLPRSFFQPPEPELVPERHVTPIFMPLTQLTQKAPNTAKVEKQFREIASPPPEPVKRSSPPPARPKPEPVRQATLPAPTPPKQAQQPPPPEPPPIDAAVGNVPKLELPQNGLPLPPPPKPQQSRLTLDNLGGPAPVVPPDQRKLTMPDTSVDAALNANLHGGGQPHLPTSGVGQQQQENLPQLLSDAQGVDFTDYLRQILRIVQANWNNIIPASARMGPRGKTSVVFSIERIGRVGKLVISRPSGTQSYDNAAVAAVSASQPFPPLPSRFKGDEIRVQFNFEYNAPKQQ